MAVPLPARPQSPEGFYAINNQFQTNGPKGFSELKILANGDMFVRMDLPGVPDEGGMSVYHNRSEESVVVYAKAPKIHTHDSTERRYLTMTGIGCSCCAISSMTTHMSDGVFRLTLSKTRIDPNRSSCIVLGCSGFREDLRGTDPNDMPGVPKENFTVSVTNGRVKVTGEAPALSHDSSGRFYSGDGAMLSTPVDIPSRRIKTIAKDGVIRLLIPPF
ncbi:Heat shock protein HSP20/alpha crystallin family [Arabidopsis thaliana]|uniref:Heat shock protein HSP20/alpha crystallin family n=1 Tax=Arabidopsis thaliana TaxID=3702 RepID=A0A1P8B7S6_ARATH|nr:Heat shock protein HSP20/alpha crystallin family [Arabidopsis thaliana]ANM67631.1 Heat shock protein HSP20/alpha crystallin family [Arabidopsis thaliana]|eukprot:NP_001329449.1 Heat shock protein HSP20/alpha crystallin family [Arabidopsis thaliana]